MTNRDKHFIIARVEKSLERVQQQREAASWDIHNGLGPQLSALEEKLWEALSLARMLP